MNLRVYLSCDNHNMSDSVDVVKQHMAHGNVNRRRVN